MDHRQGRRSRTLLLVEIQMLDGQSTDGLMYDIGPNGMFIVSESVPAVNESVDICVALSDQTNASIPIPCVVAHRRRNGYGVMFKDLKEPPEHLRRILGLDRINV